MSDNTSFSTPQWWKEAVVYQIYPASFCDQSGDGWGDIPGITSKLDYIKSLGANVVWSSPFLRSPQADMGYDISDYKDVDPIYGTLADLDTLIAEAAKRDMKVMMDLVVNHTSNMHAWFLESRSSRTSPKRDWYIWKKPSSIDPTTGEPSPPNNWAQILGEANSAWTYDPVTQEYYLSVFTPEQPDLNWENPDVRDAVWDVMKFWLARGAAGFRMDVINMISKDTAYPDAPIVLDPKSHKYQPGTQFFTNGPRLHEYLREMYREVLSKHDTITVGEMPGVSEEGEILKTVGREAGELRMIFIFDLVDIDKPNVRMALKDWDVREMKEIISRWQRVMIERDGWNSVFIENGELALLALLAKVGLVCLLEHRYLPLRTLISDRRANCRAHDNPRSVTRYTDDSDATRAAGAKLLALMQTTLGGTLFVYQGEEIGMRNAPLSWPIEEYKDIETVNYWKKCESIYADQPEKLAEARQIIQMKARDHSRTPMQWDGSKANAGFCAEGIKPWMRIMDDWREVNAEAQMRGEGVPEGELSVWQFWQRGLKDRKEHKDVFVYGDFEELKKEDENVFGYVRTSAEGEGWVVVLNFSGQQQEWVLPEGKEVEFWAAGTVGKGKPEKAVKGQITLGAWEGVLGKLKA